MSQVTQVLVIHETDQNRFIASEVQMMYSHIVSTDTVSICSRPRGFGVFSEARSLATVSPNLMGGIASTHDVLVDSLDSSIRF